MELLPFSLSLPPLFFVADKVPKAPHPSNQSPGLLSSQKLLSLFSFIKSVLTQLDRGPYQNRCVPNMLDHGCSIPNLQISNFKPTFLLLR